MLRRDFDSIRNDTALDKRNCGDGLRIRTDRRFHNAERNFPSACVAGRGRDVVILGVRTMNSPILRLARSTSAVQDGFFAAGVTTAGIVILQSFAIVLSWVVSAVV